MAGLRALVGIEFRRAIRAPRAKAVAGALFITALVAGALGASLAQGHQEAAARDREAAQQRLTTLLEQGRAPVEAALLADTVLARSISPLAALTAGDLAALPDAATVRLDAAVTAVPSRAERSPAAMLLGTFDLAWLVALLVPLALLGLGYDAIARDRSCGNLAMLLCFAPSPRGLVFARTVAIAAVAGIGLIPGVVGALLMAALWVEGAMTAASAAAVLALCFATLVAWSTIVVALSTFAARPGQALAMGLLVWAFFAVAAPLGFATLGRAAYPDPDPRIELEGLQAAQEIAADPEARVAEEADRAPELDPEAALDRLQSNLRFDLLRARAQRRRARGATHASRQAMARRAELAMLTAYLSPTTLVTRGLASLAGTDPAARARFIDLATEYQDRLDEHAAAALRNHDARPGDIEDWPAARASAIDTGATGPAGIGALLLLGLSAVLTLTSASRLRRGDAAPIPEET